MSLIEGTKEWFNAMARLKNMTKAVDEETRIWEWIKLKMWLKEEIDKAYSMREFYLSIKNGKESFLADTEHRRARDYKAVYQKMMELDKQ